MGGRGASSGKEKSGAGGSASGKSGENSASKGMSKPALAGSEKQVAWATRLRDAYIQVMSKTHADSVARTVAAHTKASYWIDNRHGLGVTNAQQREINALASQR